MVCPEKTEAPLNLTARASSDIAMNQPDWLADLKTGVAAERRERAFRLFLAEWQRPVYRFVRRMLINHEDADDVTQETLIQVAKSVDGFRGDAAFSTWLYQVANRKALDHLAASKRRRALSLSRVPGMEDHLAALAADPHFDGEEAEMRLEAGLACLPPRQKQVFILRYFEDLSYTEIAGITCLSEGSLKASYHHAAAKLKQFLIRED